MLPLPNLGEPLPVGTTICDRVPSTAIVASGCYRGGPRDGAAGGDRGHVRPLEPIAHSPSEVAALQLLTTETRRTRRGARTAELAQYSPEALE